MESRRTSGDCRLSHRSGRRSKRPRQKRSDPVASRRTHALRRSRKRYFLKAVPIRDARTRMARRRCCLRLRIPDVVARVHAKRKHSRSGSSGCFRSTLPNGRDPSGLGHFRQTGRSRALGFNARTRAIAATRALGPTYRLGVTTSVDSGRSQHAALHPIAPKSCIAAALLTARRSSALRSGTAPARGGRRSAACSADRPRWQTGAEIPATDRP